MVYSVHAFLYTLGIMSNQKYISVEEALDWLANVAAADGLIVQSERSAIKSFADSYHINADDIIEKASRALSGVKPEVEIIDYKAKNGLLFEQLIASFLKDKKRFSLLSWTGDKYIDGIYDQTNKDPDLHIQQIINNQTIDYYIECKWHHYWQRGEFDYFYEMKTEQLARYRAFQRKNHRKVIISSPKTQNSRREIPLSPELYKLLVPLMKVVNRSFYILTNDRQPTEPRTYRNYYTRLLKQLDIPVIKFHGLRHSFATRCIESHCDYKTVSVILGHANIGTTLDLYVHPNLEQKQKCINRMFKSLR